MWTPTPRTRGLIGLVAAAGFGPWCGTSAIAQTRVDLRTQTRNLTFSGPVAFPASGAGTPSFTVPGGTAPVSPAPGSFWVTGGKLWWHNGTRPAAFLTDDGTGGGLSWSLLANPTANLNLNLGSYSTTLTLGGNTQWTDGLRITDISNNSGTGVLAHFTAASGSAMLPWRADANGIGWEVDSTGSLNGFGSSVSGALTLTGAASGSCTLTVPDAGGALVPGSAAECDLGSAALPLGGLYLAGTSASPAGNHFHLTGAATAARTWTLQDATDTLVGRNTPDVLTNKSIDTASGNLLRIAGVSLTGVRGNSGSVLFAGAISGTGATLCTDSSGNATTSGCASGGGSSISPGSTFSIPSWVEYVAGVCQSGLASLSFNLPSANPPAAACRTGANTNLGVAQFSATGQNVQGAFVLPDDWTSTIAVELRFLSENAGGSGSIAWNFAYACVPASGASIDPAFSAGQTVTTAAAANNLNNVATLASPSFAGCAAGQHLFYKLTLDPATTASGNHDLIGVRFKIKRAVTTL